MTATQTHHQVVAEILAGGGISLAQAARKFPPYRQSKPVNPSTIFRWITSGVRLPDGSHLRLEAARIGGRWLTSGPAIERLIARQTPDLDTPTEPTPRTPAQRSRAARAAAQELAAIGI